MLSAARAKRRDDHLQTWSCTAERVSSLHGAIVVLRVSGEIDLLNHLELRLALTDSINGGPRHLIVDLAAVTFCSVQGLGILVETRAVATANGTDYVLSGLSASLRRHCTVLSRDALPTQYRTAATAVSAIRAGRAVVAE
jgi:anti-sigma B factor antagonist